MGRRGKPPTPTALKLLNGEKRPERLNLREPVPRQDRPEPPEEMSPEVREIWDYTVAELEHMRILVAADRDALVCFCEAVVTHRRASAILAKSSVLIKGLHGGMVRNPALSIQTHAAGVIRAFGQEFGLTPSARSRIQMEGGNDRGERANPFAVVG